MLILTLDGASSTSQHCAEMRQKEKLQRPILTIEKENMNQASTHESALLRCLVMIDLGWEHHRRRRTTKVVPSWFTRWVTDHTKSKNT